MTTVLQNQLSSELARINQLRADIIEDQKDTMHPESNPDLWRHRDGTYVLMPIMVARSQLLLAIAIERNTKK